MPITKNEIKLFNFLTLKKYRQKYGFFIAEGEKIILDILKSNIEPYKLFSTSSLDIGYNLELISEKELKIVSSQKNPNKMIGIFKIPNYNFKINLDSFILGLDSINDPGNLGTIIRICDWYGIEDIVCSENTVDCFNQKVIQSSMGSISRVRVHYLDLYNFLKNYQGDKYGAFLDGENINNIKKINKGILVMGNESNGISNSIEELINKKITISKNSYNSQIDSLNVSISAGIIIHQLKI